MRLGKCEQKSEGKQFWQTYRMGIARRRVWGIKGQPIEGGPRAGMPVTRWSANVLSWQGIILNPNQAAYTKTERPKQQRPTATYLKGSCRKASRYSQQGSSQSWSIQQQNRLEILGFDLSEWEKGKTCSTWLKFDLPISEWSVLKLDTQRADLVGKYYYYY